MSQHEDPLEDDLQLALRLSNDAAELALQYFQEGVQTIIKSDGSPVSEADRAVERQLIHELQTQRPDDAIVGEEFGASGSSTRRWILDPIDGTASFCTSDPNWRVHIALEVGGEIAVAVITEPARGRQWSARQGAGAFASSWPGGGTPTRLRVSPTKSLETATLDARKPVEHERLPAVGQRPKRAPASWCSGLIDLVNGDVDAFFVDGCQVWDHAPWVLLVQEAGGRFTDHQGGTSPGFHGGLYSNAHLHDELLTALKPPMP